jgi:hypothetical protein
MTFKKLILFSALTVLLGVGVVYALSYEFKPSPPSPSTGTLFVLAYYGVKQPDGSYIGSYVQVLVTVIGPENYTGITTTYGWFPSPTEVGNHLNFTVAPGQYSVSGTYASTPQTATVNVSAGSYSVAFLNFGSSPPPP